MTHGFTVADVLQEASKKLGFVAKKIFTPQGGIIDEVLLIK